MSNITLKKDDIRKAFIKLDGNLKIGVLVNTDDDGRIINEKSNIDRGVMPHQSLKNCFKTLLPHALNILRLVPKGSVFDEKYLKTRKIVNDTDLKDFELVGFDYSGKDDEPKIAFIVRKKCIDEVYTDIKTKPIKTHQGSTYPFSGILVNDLDDAIHEVFEYINGKYFDSDQIKISDKQDEEEEDDDDNPF